MGEDRELPDSVAAEIFEDFRRVPAFARGVWMAQAYAKWMVAKRDSAVEQLDLPLWVKGVFACFDRTIFRGCYDAQAHAEESPRALGRMLGVNLRFVAVLTKEWPKKLESEFEQLEEPKTPEEERLFGEIFGMDQVVSEQVAGILGRPAETFEDVEEAQQRLSGELEWMRRVAEAPMSKGVDEYSAAQQGELLRGVAEGYKLLFDEDLQVAGSTVRTALLFWMLFWRPEIECMRQAEPPVSRKFVLEWLARRIEPLGVKLVDEHAFHALCDNIGLRLKGPGPAIKV